MADYVVTTLVDENDGGDGGTDLSLREALALANGDPGFDTITFDASLAGQTIVLANGQLTISADVIINGDIDGDRGADITVSGNNASRVFHIEDGNAATTIAAELKGLVIRDGLAVVGGGIALGVAEQLLLTNSTVSGNRAEDGAGIYNSPNATVTLLDTTLSGNRAEFNGGGIFSYGTILLINATVSGNMAEGNSGGGILNAGTATLTNTTLSGNSAEYFGGGLHGSGAAALVNSIVAGNFANMGIGGDDISSLGPLNLTGGNIVGDTRTVHGVAQQTGIALTDIFASVTNAPLTNVLSGTLADNGGPVQTIALAVSATNPAIDAGTDAIGLGLDARGLPRVDVAGAAHNGANISDLGGFELQATPAGMIVDTLIDEAYDGGDYFAETLDGHLSLREALGLANGNADANTITFDASLAGGTLYLAGGQLSITTDGVTVDGDIDGNGNADITISADHSANANDANSRVFRIDDGNDATTIASTLNGLVIRDGFLPGGDPGNLGGGVLVGKADALTLTDSTVTDNKVVIYGGGIANLGTVTLTNTTLSDNSGAVRGGGIANFGTATLTNTTLSGNGSSDGGGIFNARDAGLTLTDTALSGNSANSRGGGILTYGAATLTNVTLSDNIAHHGGGIYSSDFNSNTTLTNTTLSGNEAAVRGGGICNYRGTATLTNTTLSGNSADQGGGIYSDDGILDSGSTTLINTTLSGNEADGSGGGIFIVDGAVTLTNSIVAGNEAGTSGDDIELDAAGILGLAGGNIVGDTFTLDGAPQQSGIALADVFASVTNDPNTGVLSGMLADNGGPVQTVALAASVTNAAIDAGNDALDAAGDARGLARLDVPGAAHNGGNISDLGAFELQASAFETPGFVVTTLSDVVDPFDNLTSLREALALANGDPDANTITFDAALTGGSNPGVDDGGIVLGGTELTISADVTINGDLDADGDADITVSGDDASRVFNVDGAGTITASLNGLVIRDGFTAVNGGGIRVAADDALTVTNSTITENVAFLGGAGGIMNYGATTLVNTVVSDNTSYTQSGGGILNLGTLDITNSTLSGNHGAYNGGAIFNAQGVVTLINSTVSDNAAGYAGGGIFNNIGGVTLTNTTVVGNEADHGGGIFNRGGASTPATLTLTNSTVSGNLASVDGGGIQNNDSTSTTTLVNTIVAGNDASSGDDVQDNGTLALSGGNIVGDTFTIDGGSPQAGVALTDIFAAIDPGTGGGQLAHNGGSVETIALNRDAANLALDNGDPDALDEAQAGLDLNGDGDTTDVVATDARGFDRDVGGVDLGAFEQQDDANFVVTTLDDGVDNDFGGGNLAAETADGGGLSLREALALANGDPTTADIITFDESLDGGTLTLQSGELVITSDVTIDGDIGGTPGITIDAGGLSRVLNIISGTSSLNGLEITGGDVTCGCYGDYGGGISVGSLFYGTTADVTISNSTIRDNTALYGGGIAVDFGSAVRLVNATVADNSADYAGGGIESHGALTIVNSTVSGNVAGYIGGGIANDGALTVANSTLSGNRSDLASGIYAPNAGGGLYNAGTATLTSTTISGNTSGYAGGGIYNSGSLTLTNATVANNTAVYGGGLYNADCGCGDVTIDNATFSGNFASEVGGGIYNAAGTVALANSIVAGNGAGYSNPDIATDTGFATTTFGGVNVFSQAGAGDAEDIDGAALSDIFASVVEIDLTPVDGDEFQAGRLQNNGGPVATIAILAGGVAYDAGSDADAVFDDDGDPATPDVPIPTDARGLGFNRFIGQHVDVGAFESQNVPPAIDLDGGGGGTGFAATYLENAAPIQVVDNAITIDDPNDPNLAAATVVLANAQAGDVMTVGDLTGLGITSSIDTSVAGQITVTLTGPSLDTNFETALKRVFFGNASETPATTQRVLNITVSDGTLTSPNATTTIDIVSQNDAPVNSAPATQNVEGNHDLAIGGLAITDVDAGGASLTTTLSVLHGTLAVASAGGAAVGGSGTATVTLTGTVTQINTTLAAANNVVYSPAHDFFGTDTLTMLTDDGGNAGLVGGVQTDTDLVTINVNTLLTGTPEPDSFNAPLGQSRVDGLGSAADTITFNFALTDATVTYQGNKVIIDHGSSHTVTTGLETFVFTDGIVNNADANWLVDDLFYYSRHHDVWNAHVDADLHYGFTGWKEGRDPNAFFDTSIYLAANPDVAASGGNPLTHYDTVGWTQGRVPSLAFGTREYLDAHPDVKAAGIDPLFHFLVVGAGEGRQPIAPSELIAANGFDFVYYLANNPDVAAAGVDPFWHFQNTGWKEGRDPNALFDTSGYLATYADVAAAHINPLDHYNLAGWKEGRDPSVGFDTTSYLAAYTDVAAANINPLTHFLHIGIHEGRQPFADGVWG